MDFLINLETRITESYLAWQWHTFPPEHSTEAKRIIDRNMVELQQWAMTMGIVSMPEEQYQFIGDSITSIGRTKKAGLFRYDLKPLLPELGQLGLSKDAQCIVLHMNPLIEQKEINANIINLFSLRSFKKIINAVRKKYQTVQVIVAESWLLDTPIGTRLGFQLFPQKSELVPWNDGFWGQFIDQYGNIHTERVNHFLKTGKPPYQVRKGYILVKDIL